jgi:hypothetical protein
MKFFLSKIIAIAMLGFILSTSTAHANTARESAKLVLPEDIISQTDNRSVLLRDFLAERGSPLAPHAATFVAEADRNGLDWRLVVSIAGNESGFGHKIPPYSNNAWGYGVYGGNVIRFSTWDEGIATVSGAIKKNYIDKWGATNVYEIGDIYAADPHWAQKVTFFMNQIEAYESDRTKSAISISI